MKKVYPSMQMQNMRHRGPVESKKMNRFMLETEENLKVLMQQLEVIEENINNYHKDIDTFVTYEKVLDYRQKEIEMIGGELRG